jgi:hypothetical protein
MEVTVSSNQPAPLVSVRAALILLLAALVGLATAYLTALGGGTLAAAALAGGGTAGGATALFNSLIGK